MSKPLNYLVGNTFGERLTAARINKGLSQVDLGMICKMTQQAVSLYESNAAFPPEKVLEILSKKLGVTPYWLRYGAAPGTEIKQLIERIDILEEKIKNIEKKLK